MADWGEPRSPREKVAALAIRKFDGDEPTRDNLAGRLPELFEAGGLTEARERKRVPRAARCHLAVQRPPRGVTRNACVVVLAVASLLLLAAPAHAVRCQDVYSKIDQSESLAPFVVGDSVTVAAGKYLGEQGFAVNAVGCRTFAQGLDVMSATASPRPGRRRARQQRRR